MFVLLPVWRCDVWRLVKLIKYFKTLKKSKSGLCRPLSWLILTSADELRQNLKAHLKLRGFSSWKLEQHWPVTTFQIWSWPSEATQNHSLSRRLCKSELQCDSNILFYNFTTVADKTGNSLSTCEHITSLILNMLLYKTIMFPYQQQ